jgi:hypothetical protein
LVFCFKNIIKIQISVNTATCGVKEMVNLTQEYWQWRNGRDSICRYPFMLSATVKTDILRVDAEHQVRACVCVCVCVWRGYLMEGTFPNRFC